MQFLRLNERMALYMCKYLALTIAMYVYSYVPFFLSLTHARSLTLSLSVFIVHLYVLYCISIYKCTMCNVSSIVWGPNIHSVLQSFIVLGYSKICSRKIVSRAFIYTNRSFSTLFNIRAVDTHSLNCFSQANIRIDVLCIS